MKKALSLILSLLLLMQLFPTLVWADPAPWPEPYLEVTGIRIYDLTLVEGSHPDPGNPGRYDYVSALKDGFTMEEEYFLDGFEHVTVDISWEEAVERFGVPVFADDQAEHPWGLGTHEVQASIGEFETRFTVTIVENPVACIWAADRWCIANWDDLPEPDENGLLRRHVDLSSPELSLELKDGGAIMTGWEAINYAASFHESPVFLPTEGTAWTETALTPGDIHPVVCRMFGLETAYQIQVEESPVERLTASDLELLPWIEGWEEGGTYTSTGGCWVDGDFTMRIYDLVCGGMDYTLRADAPYIPAFDPDSGDTYCRIILPDGTAAGYSAIVPQEDMTLTLNCLGREVPVQIRFLPSPVTAVELECNELWEGIGREGYLEWDPETDEGTYVEGAYSLSRLPLAVRFADGRVIRCPIEQLEIALGLKTGIYPRLRLESGQEEEAWDLGMHSIDLYLLGTVYSLPVAVIPCPMESFTVDDLTLLAHTSGSWEPVINESTGKPIPGKTWFCYSIMPEMTLNMKDGSVITGTPEEIAERTHYPVWVSVEQYQDQPLQPGRYAAELEFCGTQVGFLLTILPDNVFTDVPEKAWYAEAVQWAMNHFVTKGTTDTTFSPKKTCTRGQAVTFLWRAMDCPAPESWDCAFTDWKAGAYYASAVLWAVEQGIANGLTDTTFGPDKPCTRAQVVTFLWRAMGSPKPERSDCPFTDVGKKAYFRNAVLWAVERGITTGTTDTTFSPNKTCTRAEIVTFLWRAFADGT